MASALEQVGVTVHRMQENRVTPADVVGAAMGADFVLYTRTWGLPAEEMIAGWRRLEQAGVPSVSYHLDLYVGLEREATLAGDPFWATTMVCTPDGDPKSAELFETVGVDHRWFPPAVHGPECIPGTVRDTFEHDLVFVGSYPYPHPEWPYRDRLVRWAHDRYGTGFARYGGANVVRGAPLNDLYASSKVVLGDSLCPGFTKPGYWSDRLPETLGRGGCLVMPYVDGMTDEGFTDGEHLRFYEFNDFDALGGIVDDLLADRPERDRLRAGGQRFVAGRHTYRHRMERLIGMVESL